MTNHRTDPQTPLVSVIMPVFNGIRFLDEALDSLLSQSYASLEIIAIDDGSCDGSLSRLHQKAAIDLRVVPMSVEHGGIAAARNAGLAAAGGQFITFLDQDDLCPPGKMARHVQRLSQNATAMAVFGRTLTTVDPPETRVLTEPSEEPYPLTMILSAATFRVAAFDLIGSFDPSYALADDMDFLLRLLEAELQIEVETNLATVHRRHPGQATADLEATRRECMLALRASLRRRRQKGIIGPLPNPFDGAGLP